MFQHKVNIVVELHNPTNRVYYLKNERPITAKKEKKLIIPIPESKTAAEAQSDCVNRTLFVEYVLVSK